MLLKTNSYTEKRLPKTFYNIYIKKRTRETQQCHPAHPNSDQEPAEATPDPKDKRRSPEGRGSQGQQPRAKTDSTASRKTPAGRKGRRSNSEAIAQGRTPQHPTGRESGRLGKGTAKATPAAPTPTPDALGRPRRGFRAFPLLQPPPPRLSTPPTARKMDFRQRAKLADQPHPPLQDI